MLYSLIHQNQIQFIRVADKYYADRSEWLMVPKPDRERWLHFDLCTCVAGRRKNLMFTGQSACAVLRIPRLDAYEMRPHCISAIHRPVDIVRWHISAPDPAAKIVDGLLVASPIRAICDLAKTDSPESLLVAINHCLFHKMFTKKQFAEALDNRPGITGGPLLRRILQFATPDCESPLETIAWISIHNAGFVMPQQQRNIYDGQKFVGRVDMCWEVYRKKIVLELDGNLKYIGGNADPDASLIPEKDRQEALEDLHYKVIRASWKTVTEGRLPEKLEKKKILKRRFSGKAFLCTNPDYEKLNHMGGGRSTPASSNCKTPIMKN